MIKYLMFICIAVMSFGATSQTIEGVWKSYDDDSGVLKSEVKIYIKNGKLYGKIVKLHNLDVPYDEALCYLCTDYRKDKHVMGMEIISGLDKDGNEWTGDTKLLDPENGKSYDATLWLIDDNKLAVRGYVGWFFRTQYWLRK